MDKGFGLLLNLVRGRKPLVHHITNYVTVNDCAYITLGIGASPVMGDSVEEAADISAAADALVLNMGTLSERAVASMIAAGRSANAKGIPVVLDPVGVGGTKFRSAAAVRLVSEIELTVIRGNISEIKFMAGLDSKTKGVDASEAVSADDAGQVAKGLAKKLNCIVVVSGAVDVISDGSKTAFIENGHPMLSSVSGTGCMCSSLIGSFCGASPNEAFAAASAAMACMGAAGETAHEKAGHLGNGSFRIALHDAVSRMDGETLERLVKYREV